MQHHLFLLFLFILLTQSLIADLLNGPMITHTTMHSTQIWTQLDQEGQVFVEYWDQSNPSEIFRSKTYSSSYADDHIVKLRLTKDIDPGITYGYRVAVDGEIEKSTNYTFQSKPRWRWVPDQESDSRHSIFDFRIAIGSCAYINDPIGDRQGGEPYGASYQIFDSIHQKAPDIMLWLGDSVYYRENDYEHREGLLYRWRHDRQVEEMRKLFANTIHYAIWDDHDYGPNDIGRNYWLKESATEVFNLVWGNPSAGLPETPGIFTFVNWGDVNIYLLDNRTNLTPTGSYPESFGQEKVCFGKKQLDWLIDHLAWSQSQSRHDGKSYPARFNLIVSGNQVLNDSGNPHGFRAFKEEWQYLMDRIVAEDIRGVIFLSGDVHFGEVNRVEHTWKGKTTPLIEVTSSPLTSGFWKGHEKNSARFDIFEGEQDRVGQRNFATLDFEGPLDDRRMIVRFWDSDGNLINQKTNSPLGTPTDASVFHANDLVRAGHN